MHGIYLSLAAVAVGLASANTYPDCEPDNCYRNLNDTRFQDTGAFCVKLLSETITEPTYIPLDYGNCANDIAAVSSACSCITYSLSTSSTYPPTTSTYPPTTYATTTTSASTYKTTEATTEYVPYTTSTIYATTEYTVTSCPPTVTDCPGKGSVTTEVYVLSTTVCPVYPATPVYPDTYTSVPTVPAYSNTTLSYVPYTPVGTAPGYPSGSATTSGPLVQVTSAAGRVVGAAEGLIAAGVAAIAFIL